MEIKKRILQIIAEDLDIDDATDYEMCWFKDSYKGQGCDELDTITIIMDIEKEFNTMFTEAQIEQLEYRGTGWSWAEKIEKFINGA